LNSHRHSSAVELFKHCGVVLAEQRAPLRSLRVETYLAACPSARRLVCLPGRRTAAAAANQLLLTLAQSPSRVVTLPPRHTWMYLDYGVFDAFRDVRSLRRPALALEARGILLLGQLVQRPYGEIAYLIGDAAAAAMGEELAKVGLTFGVSAPNWSRVLEFVSTNYAR
jgi:hypothetical protein